MLSDIEIYLPKYLSPAEQTKLFEELKQFPANIHNRLYSSQRDPDAIIFQGDGLENLPIISLPSTDVLYAMVMVLSNTCDIAPNNNRMYTPSIIYCPLIRLGAYRDSLLEAYPEEANRVDDHIDSLKRQECSSMFYLPPGLRLEEERIALFDQVVHHRTDALNFDGLVNNRLFTLSEYGFYLFLFKLSVHFTRLREGVVRGYTD